MMPKDIGIKMNTNNNKNNKKIQGETRKMVKTTDGIPAIMFLIHKYSHCHYGQNVKDRTKKRT